MKKSIVIVTHKFVTHPDDELVFYLNKKSYPNILHVCHSFYDAPDRKSYYKWYKNGKLYKQKYSLDYNNFPEPIIYIKEILYTFFWIVSTKTKWDFYIGMDGLCVLVGNILKYTKTVNKTAYWAIDFVPKNRFPGKIANSIYHWINTLGYKNSDEMWDLSPRMAEARQKYLRIDKSDYKKLRLVPYGNWTQKIKKFTYKDCEQSTLVFMGRITRAQGAQLVIKAIPGILKTIPRFRFKVIGTGPYKEELLKLSKKIGVESHCDFLGKIDSHQKVELEIAKSALAIAPYIKQLDSWTYYADPGKVKTYLACGVPVLLTDLPWNAKDIEKNKCGKIISLTISDIIKNIILLMDKSQNQKFRENAISYSKSFDYNTIFSKLDL